jgi:hypothetical protein
VQELGPRLKPDLGHRAGDRAGRGSVQGGLRKFGLPTYMMGSGGK